MEEAHLFLRELLIHRVDQVEVWAELATAWEVNLIRLDLDLMIQMVFPKIHP